MSERLLIKGGTVLSLDRSVGNMDTADVLIEDGRIGEVGPSLRARNAEIVDATDAIVMPGFVDTHRHCWHALFRNVGRSPSAFAAGDLRGHYGADQVYAATLASLLGAAEAGVTTVVDWADLPVEPSCTEAALQAHADAGLRTVFVVAPSAGSDARRDAAGLRTLVGGSRAPNITLAYGSRELANDEIVAIATEWGIARGEGLRIHAHAGVEPSTRGVVAALGSAGLLGEDVTLAHCSLLGEDDLDAVASSKTSVSITPSLEMTAGLGPPPLQAFIDRGIRPGLGVGSEFEAPGDIFAQMRAANSVQHATLFDLKLAGKGGVPNLLTTRDVIRYGTVDGARVAGVGNVTGTLTPGKQGDVIVLRADRPNIAPINDPIGAVVWGMDTSNIDWVMVGGRPIVRDGELTADVARVGELVARAHREVAAASGLLVDAGTERP